MKIPAAFAVVVCMNDFIQIPFDQSNANAAFAFVVVFADAFVGSIKGPRATMGTSPCTIPLY
jgi:hypothetical protein